MPSFPRYIRKIIFSMAVFIWSSGLNNIITLVWKKKWLSGRWTYNAFRLFWSSQNKYALTSTEYIKRVFYGMPMVIIPCTPRGKNKAWNSATSLEKNKMIRWCWGHCVDFSFPYSPHSMTFQVLAATLQRRKYLVDREDSGQGLITL